MERSTADTLDQVSEVGPEEGELVCLFYLDIQDRTKPRIKSSINFLTFALKPPYPLVEI